MASNLGCVGLAVHDEPEMWELVDRMLPDSVELGQVDGISVRRWEGPSGSRLVLGLRGSECVDLLPSFAAPPGARLAHLRRLDDELLVATAVLDEDGEQCTAMTVELEEARLLGVPTGMAGITALGVDVQVFADAEAFGADEASRVSPGEPAGEPPAHWDPAWEWPPRVAAESFMDLGAFAAPGDASAHARLAGTVLGAELRTVALTGQRFVTARVRTVGFEATVCLPADDHPVPAPGNVVHGTVYLVGSVPVAPEQRRRWWARRG